MINMEMSEEMFGGDKEFITILFGQYLQDNKDINTKIQSQYDGDQFQDLFHTAHTLAGALANICEVDIVPIIKNVEKMSKEGDKPDAGEIALIQSSLDDIFKQMEAYLAG